METIQESKETENKRYFIEAKVEMYYSKEITAKDKYEALDKAEESWFNVECWEDENFFTDKEPTLTILEVNDKEVKKCSQ